MGHYFASPIRMIVGLVLLAIAFESVHSTITVQIGSSGGLSSAGRRPGRYYCYWDCDLVGCQFEFDYDDDDDDECAYDCRKVCRPRYDFAAKARSSSSEKAETILPPSGEKVAPEVEGAGNLVRLHLPRNASARNFAIWERCPSDEDTGKPLNL